MRTVVLGPRPVEVEAFVERRRQLGQDLYDEVWEGEYHVVPGPSRPHADVQAQLIAMFEPMARAQGYRASGPFNVGGPDDFRVPDLGVHRTPPEGVWAETVALVAEVVSPDDEVLIADPAAHLVRIWHRQGDRYDEADRSTVLGVTTAALADRLDWPDPQPR